MARVPRRLMKDPAKAGLSADEEHLLGCVDGSLSEDELCFVTGKGPDRIAAMLERLAEHGLVSFGADPSSEDAGIADPQTADGIELSVEARQRIDDMFPLVGNVDHYRLLDLPRDATKDEIKKAYYRLAPKFHPDKHYGKELGEYKGKIETIFSALTKAHDTLRYDKRRKTYDAGLPPLKPGDRIRRRPSAESTPRVSQPEVPAARPSRPGVPPARPRIPSAPGSDPGRISVEAGRVSGVPPMRPRSQSRPTIPSRPSVPASPTMPSAPSDAPRDSVPPGDRPSVPGHRTSLNPRPRARPVSEAERDALRRKLGRRGAGPPRRPRPIAEVRQVRRDVEEIDKPDRVRPSAAEVLRGRYDQVRDTAKRQRLAKYLETARVAMEAGDYRAAAAAFEQAARLSPDDEEIQRKARMAAEMALGRSVT